MCGDPPRGASASLSTAEGMLFTRSLKKEMRSTGFSGPATEFIDAAAAPPPPSARKFGLWKPGRQRLPQRIRQEVSLQREMAQLLEQIIDTAHFQDETAPVEAQQTLKVTTETWPTLEFPLNYAPQEPQEKAQIEVLLQQSNLYGSGKTAETTAELVPPEEVLSRSSSKQMDERNMSKRRLGSKSKKPAVPKTSVKKSPSGWHHLRVAATALRPFGGFSDAVKRSSSSPKPAEVEDEEELAEEELKEPVQEEEEAKSKNSALNIFSMCFDLSKEYLVPLDEVKKCFDEFKRIDVSGDLLISLDEFEVSVRQNMGWPVDQELTPEMQERISKYFKEMDRDCSEQIDFPEYFDWSMKHRWTEEFLARDEKDLENRRLAREAGISISDVERYRQMFDDFDTDGSSEISQTEFVYVIMQIMGVKDARDIPAPTLNRYWQEVDTDGSGSVSFREFLVWMLTKGPS